MSDLKLANEYKEYVFIKAQLEDCLGFPLSHESDMLPDYLKPYKTRVGIQLKEAANILAGFKPKDIRNRTPDFDVVSGYEDSLWDAVDNGILSGTNGITNYDFNQEYRVDITLVKDEVTLWAKKHDFNWPFPIISQDGGDGESKECLEDIIRRLEAENESLKKEIFDAKNKIPSMLGVYRKDDPLMIAIEIRNEEWAAYDEDNKRTIPTQDALIAQLLQKYKKFSMSDALARSIEKVACPILRK
ncbi:hypothetical protein ACVQK1_14255 [Edwardsiella tarda]